MTGRYKVLIVLIVLVVGVIAFLYYGVENHQETCEQQKVYFSFNLEKALNFYESLNTSLGLLSEYPRSHTIWLADDQSLDYNALMLIYNITHNVTAKTLAEQILLAIKPYGGLYKYYNSVFEIFGIYPNTTTPQSGVNIIIGNIDNYTFKVTLFNHTISNYYDYADLLAYRVLLWLHLGNYSGAEENFINLVKMWNGIGFNDSAYYNDTYQSYKLALFLIVWRALELNPHTCLLAIKYVNIAREVSDIMSLLQSSQGGVWTGYKYVNGKIEYGYNISLMNGETTSLFVIAYALMSSNISIPITS
ncbi:hypothetical protein [Saccharolobus islandicus]|uniref:Uncharacterized protein n=2 Tax=Saccharolobus islandicus TaxID=43080 RepID=C3MSB0_SACI4|nr:hypothetical protein [Sulfolobus islandicus]ACP39053.1 conserved hypothetical protein [Sulfolobus islandicus M.14.25]ACP56258.1 conserved hypothetical protein [Sulfolobus islandicus M.16.27]